MKEKFVSANKVMTVSEIVSKISDGMTVGIGGWGGRRKPMAVVRELLRSSVKDLTVVAYGGMDVSLLAAAGKISCLVYGFVSHDVIPMDQAFRQARQSGAFEFREIDEGMLQWGLRAAAMGLPFLPTRAGIGTDVETLNPWIKTVRSPYVDGELLLAMPALNLDVAVIHVNEADAQGHTAILGPDPFFDDMFCRAAKKSYVTCEKLVETEAFNDPMKARLMPVERSVISGVAEVPLGAHPTSCGPDYGIDVKHISAYTKRCAMKEWNAYRDEFLTKDTHDVYVVAVGGAEHIRALPLPVF
jgi:glutaconate CoA-transferase, subunit A